MWGCGGTPEPGPDAEPAGCRRSRPAGTGGADANSPFRCACRDRTDSPRSPPGSLRDIRLRRRTPSGHRVISDAKPARTSALDGVMYRSGGGPESSSPKV
ncbi:hypothetical protein GCM10010405_04090 [Streptomyces macrosporus]|uniref:Uncharacterized protein n=1 Tax=Streptomyces macrosporus TaxID=44032 RepID=A0ABN3J8T6_9ACTN